MNKEIIENNKSGIKPITFAEIPIEINKAFKFIKLLQDRIEILENIIMTSGTPE